MNETMDIREQEKLACVREALNTDGPAAAVALIRSMIESGTMTKGATIAAGISEIEERLREDDFETMNILDIYRGIPALKKLYVDNAGKREQMQETLDKLIQGQIRMSDITKPFDHLYLRGLCEFLGIESERGRNEAEMEVA